MCGVLHHGKRASMSDCRMGNLLGRYSFQGGIAQWGIWVDSLEACGSAGMVIFYAKNPLPAGGQTGKLFPVETQTTVWMRDQKQS